MLRSKIMGKMRTKAVIWLALLLGTSVCASALDPSLDVSQYAHTSWKIREGFTNGTIFTMAQTPDGYLWLGTEFGLVRFDGVQPVRWQPPDGEQLPSNWIDALLVARDGTLWIATDKGLASWKNGKLTSIRKLPGAELIHCCKMPKERFGLAFENPGRLCAVRAAKTQVLRSREFRPVQYPPCTRTTKAICGSRLKRVCGDGRLALQSTTRCPGAQLRPRRSSKTTTAHS